MWPNRLLYLVGVLLIAIACWNGFGAFMLMLHSDHATCCYVRPVIEQRTEKLLRAAHIDQYETSVFLASIERPLTPHMGNKVQPGSSEPAVLEEIISKTGQWLSDDAATTWEQAVMSHAESKGTTFLVLLPLGIAVLVLTRKVSNLIPRDDDADSTMKERYS